VVDDTRDIVIATREKVDGLKYAMEALILESRLHREAIDKKLDAYDELINKGKGAWWTLGPLGAIAGYVASYLPHPQIFGK